MRGSLLDEFREPSNGKLLLVSCSARKRKVRGRRVPAQALYAGTLLQLALRFAYFWGYHPLILSAKYGFIEVDSIISDYDQKRTEPYDGPWPEGQGYFVGSDLYFGKAPRRFKRLLPEGLPIGKQLALLSKYIGRGIP